MPLNLKKLSVGSTDIKSLEAWHDEVLATRGRIVHVTRAFPKRADEILPGGSIYWVIKGKMVVRQVIDEFIEVGREDGGVSCGIALAPGLIAVRPKRHRPFQGWRYLEAADAPPDIRGRDDDGEEMPEEMTEELREYGLL